ncbi:MAG: dTDP-4-dehydrorhamnose 3,5-epimerase [Candidatus Peribacteraceae bacterium]
MKIKETSLPGVYTVDIDRHTDVRGFFARTWDRESAEKLGLIQQFDYTCISGNAKKGTLRGMHYQIDAHGETKLVRCTKGSMFDVVIDLRPNSPTFKKWIGADLSAENHSALYIPTGCAHGFITMQDDTEVLYQIHGNYNADASKGVRWNDPAFGIEWPMQPTILSERDTAYPDIV